MIIVRVCMCMYMWRAFKHVCVSVCVDTWLCVGVHFRHLCAGLRLTLAFLFSISILSIALETHLNSELTKTRQPSDSSCSQDLLPQPLESFGSQEGCPIFSVYLSSESQNFHSHTCRASSFLDEPFPSSEPYTFQCKDRTF